MNKGKKMEIKTGNAIKSNGGHIHKVKTQAIRKMRK